jgi:hypothetical protein
MRGSALTGAPAKKDIQWVTNAPVLDQGDLGSCTGNALTQCLNTTKFAKSRPGGRYLKEANAVSLYSMATVLDDDPQNYPPTDTGSDGVSVCKAGVKQGYLAGYTHAFGFDHFADSMAISPMIVGTNWYSGMMTPDKSGLVKVRGNFEGGHEYLAIGISYSLQLVKFENSWSADWGKKGFFYMSFADFRLLLSQDGDATMPIGKV